MKYVDHYQSMEVSFWETFPMFGEVQPFKKLYKEDRSKDKNKSSKVMWYCVLTKDLDSEFYSLDEHERKETLSDMVGFDVYDYFKGRDGGMDDMLLEFELFIDTPLAADVRSLEEKLVERTKFIKKTPYTLDEMRYAVTKLNDDGDEVEVPCKPYTVKGTAPQLDKMFTETKRIHEEIRQLRDALSSEAAEQGKGGQMSSFIEG